MQFGYARVSTADQDTALQMVAFKAAGIDRVIQEKMSAVAKRPLLTRLLYMLRRGDVLCVYKVDRLARSLSDLLRIIARLEALGASLRSLTEPLDTGTPIGRMMLHLLGCFAEFERAVIRERSDAGRVAAKARGVRFGRPRKIDVSALPALRAQGLNARQIAEVFGVDTSSVTIWLLKLGLNPTGGVSRSKKLVRYHVTGTGPDNKKPPQGRSSVPVW
jgi:DNA invertase Pin-like site-specific DNA recombinase